MVNSGQTISARTEVKFARQKGQPGSIRVPTPPLRQQKGQGKSGTEGVELVLTPLISRIVLSYTYPQKRTKQVLIPHIHLFMAGSAILEKCLRLAGSLLTLPPKQKVSQEHLIQSERMMAHIYL